MKKGIITILIVFSLGVIFILGIVFIKTSQPKAPKEFELRTVPKRVVPETGALEEVVEGQERGEVFMGVMPQWGARKKGESFVIDIVLNTSNNPIDGVDIHYLSYNPEYLEVQDSDANTPGVQIEAGKLMPLTVSNTVDVKAGKITFSQIVSGGTKFQNSSSENLARIHLKALQAGVAHVDFDFVPQATRDANVTSGGKDILSFVNRGSYTIQ